MKNQLQIAIVIIGSIALMGALAWWGGQQTSELENLTSDDTENFQAPLTVEEQQTTNPNNVNTMNPIAIFKTTLGTFELELFTDVMPVTTGNFVKLAEEGFYDNTKFHRVIDSFMVQGGDPNSKTPDESTWGTGGPDYRIADEHIVGDKLTNARGTISMANSGPNSGGSQFFINLVDNTFLDFDKEPLGSKHPVFGQVVSGLEVVDAIGKAETKSRDIPATPIVVESVTIVQR